MWFFQKQNNKSLVITLIIPSKWWKITHFVRDLYCKISLLVDLNISGGKFCALIVVGLVRRFIVYIYIYIFLDDWILNTFFQLWCISVLSPSSQLAQRSTTVYHVFPCDRHVRFVGNVRGKFQAPVYVPTNDL